MADVLLTPEEQRQVEEGEAAGLLLDNPAFLLAIERIRAQCAEGILASEPTATEVRENLYNLSRGLSAVTEELLTMSSTAASIIENAKLQTEDDDEVQAEEPDPVADY